MNKLWLAVYAWTLCLEFWNIKLPHDIDRSANKLRTPSISNPGVCSLLREARQYRQYVETIRLQGELFSIMLPLIKLKVKTDNYLLPRRPSLPSRVRTRSHLARRNSVRYTRKRWHRTSSRTKSNQQAPRTRHLSGEALHTQ